MDLKTNEIKKKKEQVQKIRWRVFFVRNKKKREIVEKRRKEERWTK